jgi:hypothetical protein
MYDQTQGSRAVFSLLIMLYNFHVYGYGRGSN